MKKMLFVCALMASFNSFGVNDPVYIKARILTLKCVKDSNFFEGQNKSSLSEMQQRLIFSDEQAKELNELEALLQSSKRID